MTRGLTKMTFGGTAAAQSDERRIRNGHEDEGTVDQEDWGLCHGPWGDITRQQCAAAICLS